MQRRRRDPFADLHALRRRMAAEFNYDSLRLLEHIESMPLPPGFQFAESEPRSKRGGRKSAKLLEV